MSYSRTQINIVPPVRLEHATPRSQDKHSTTEQHTNKSHFEIEAKNIERIPGKDVSICPLLARIQ